MLVLLTNDDGVLAEGLLALRAQMASFGDVVVCAPEQDCSATSHKLTIDRPIRYREVSPDVYAVDGTPVDCLTIAFNCILDRRPDMVLSGINHGPNLGQDVFFSGTVAAALEAAMSGIPAAALSLTTRETRFLPDAASTSLRVARFLAEGAVPPGVVLNVNMPGRPTGVRITRLGRRQYVDAVVGFHGPNGQRACWIGGGRAVWEDDDASDHDAVTRGFVSLTPLGYDLTRVDLMAALRAAEYLADDF